MVRVIDVDLDAVITATGLLAACRNSESWDTPASTACSSAPVTANTAMALDGPPAMTAGQIAEYAIVEIAVEQRYIGIGDLPFDARGSNAA